MRNSALFVALEDLLDANGEMVPNAAWLLADIQAHGHPLIGLCDGSRLDCGPSGPVERLRHRLREVCGAAFTAIVVLDNAYAPKPLWACARRFGLSLEDSMLLTDGRHSGVALTAGIQDLRSCTLALREGYSAA